MYETDFPVQFENKGTIDTLEISHVTENENGKARTVGEVEEKTAALLKGLKHDDLQHGFQR